MVVEMINRNHFIYWVVNHWNPFKLENSVSVIMLATLNWRIYHNYNPFKLEQLEVVHGIFVIVRLWFEVLIWYWIFEWCIDLPNLQSITLGKGAFEDSPTFDLSSLSSLESIELGNYCFWEVPTFQIDGFNRLTTLIIGDYTFGLVPAFQIDGLNRLKTIKIGSNSFTQLKQSNWDWRKADNKSKSFHILNCGSLESIQIGEYSFSDFAGDFELKNLPQLQSIQIGTIGSDSYNFYNSSFVIRGIDMILNIWMMYRSSKSTIHYIRWFCI